MNHFSLLSPYLTNPVHLAITLAVLAVAIWIIVNDWRGPEGRP
jgi:hypothetical protein